MLWVDINAGAVHSGTVADGRIEAGAQLTGRLFACQVGTSALPVALWSGAAVIAPR